MGCGCGSQRQELVALGSSSEIRNISAEINWRDVLGGWRVRWGIGRMRYRVDPGLYRIGQADENSPVLVTANYKLTVDAVRRELSGMSVWLLILDTKGVNVWCAAGKGIFGTLEVVNRIRATNLHQVVKHRRLVLPQLGATGVAAHEVKRATGFTVYYGPVRAQDIPEYLAAGMKATPEMRRVTFGWRDRLVLTPNEIVQAPKPLLIGLVILVLLEVIAHRRLGSEVVTDFLPFVVAVLTGGVLVPLLLPLLPFRPFAMKGAVAGAVVFGGLFLVLPMGALEAVGTGLLVLAITSYMAMMFTGATTFTTLSGVRVEVRYALPAILTAAGIGAVLRGAAVFI